MRFPHDSDVNHTLALSTTMCQFLEKHKIISPRTDPAATARSPCTREHAQLSGEVAERLTNGGNNIASDDTSNNILDVRRLKTLPKLF